MRSTMNQQRVHPSGRGLSGALRARRRGGYSLVEVLIALALFAVGMIAVASLFPVAALLQRETADEVIGEQAAKSAAAIIEGRGLTYAPPAVRATKPGELDSYHSKAGRSKSDAVPLSAIDLQLLVRRFPAVDRGYPTYVPQPFGVTDTTDRDLFWVPFLRDLDGDPDRPSWVMILFLMESDSRATYPEPGDLNPLRCANPLDPEYFPKVESIDCKVSGEQTFVLQDVNHGLEGGDLIMDNNGSYYTVAEAENGKAAVTIVGRILLSPATPNKVWLAKPHKGSGSPTKRIIIVTPTIETLKESTNP